MNSECVCARLSRRNSSRQIPVALCCFVVLLLLTLPWMPLAAAQQVGGQLPPGVTLPVRGGIYAVQASAAKAETVRLHASQIMSNSHAGSNFARSMVYAGPHSSVELDGLNAANHLQSAGLSFLIRLSDDSPDLMKEQLALVRLRQEEKRRVVSVYSQNIFGGQHKRQYDVIPVTKTDVGGPDASWALLSPNQPLPAGEYGLIFLPKDPNLFSGEVYDFNVDFETAKPEAEASKTKK